MSAAHSTQVVTICGVDGTGKTTLIKNIEKSDFARNKKVMALRTPQFHECVAVPHELGAVSKAADQLGLLADRVNAPALKAAALFLAMSLTGDVIAALTDRKHGQMVPLLLILERDPYLDTISYASLYLSELKSGGAGSMQIGAIVEQNLGRETLGVIVNWIAALNERFTGTKGPCGFAELMAIIAGVFSGGINAQKKNIEKVFHVREPEKTFILAASPALIEERLVLKAQNAPREFHERTDVLLRLQEKYFQIADGLNRTVKRIDVDGLSPEQLCEKVAGELQLL
jgi:thymidylate kinase